MKKKLKITNSEQFQTLISELEKNPSLACRFHRGTTSSNFKRDWEEITTKLNSIGPPMRNSDGWQKVWRDYKLKVKRKLIQKEGEQSATFSMKSKRITLHPLEEAAVNLIQSSEQISAEVEDSDSQSVAKIKSENVCMLDETNVDKKDNLHSNVDNELSDHELAAPHRKKRRQSEHNEERQNLLEKVLSEMSYTLIEVGHVLNSYSQYQQKLLEIEEKKFMMLKKRHEREEQLFKIEMKLNNIKLKIKTKELEILEKRRTL